jgi:hypothetical protein
MSVGHARRTTYANIRVSMSELREGGRGSTKELHPERIIDLSRLWFN